MADKKKDTRKRSGRAMPPPEDPKDVNVKAGSPAAENLTLQSEGESTQQTLLEDAGAEVAESLTAQVKNDMVLMNFVKTSLLKERGTDQRYVCLNLSAIISDEAAELFSDKISSRYEMMSDDEGIEELGANDIPPQLLHITRAGDDKELLHLVVQPQRVKLEWKQIKGSGEEIRGIRLSFIAPVKLSAEVLEMAAHNFSTLVFVKMVDSQGRLKASKAERVA
jgi:hypothetical protein